MNQISAQSNQHGSDQFKNDISEACPGLTAQLVKRFPKSVATEKVHIDRV